MRKLSRRHLTTTHQYTNKYTETHHLCALPPKYKTTYRCTSLVATQPSRYNWDISSTWYMTESCANRVVRPTCQPSTSVHGYMWTASLFVTCLLILVVYIIALCSSINTITFFSLYVRCCPLKDLTLLMTCRIRCDASALIFQHTLFDTPSRHFSSELYSTLPRRVAHVGPLRGLCNKVVSLEISIHIVGNNQLAGARSSQTVCK
jgi:hypothetical protein